MESRVVKADQERMFLIAMATRRKFLQGIDAAADPKLFKAKYVQLMAGWCLNYFRQFGRAPRSGELEGLFQEWDAGGPPPGESSAVRDLLEGLSAESDVRKRPNLQYLHKAFSKYMTLRKAEMLRDQLSNCLLRNNEKEALEAITSFRSVDLGGSVGFDALNDMAVWRQAFAAPMKPIIKMPDGPLSYFFDEALFRGNLLGIQAPQKRGKTNWCYEFAFRALRSGCKVAMFQVGDLNKVQTMQRLLVRIEAKPLKEKYCRDLLLPEEIRVVKNEDGQLEAEVFGSTVHPERTIRFESAWKMKERFLERYGLPGDVPYFMIDVEPNSTFTVRQIRSTLQRWEDEISYRPDVCIAKGSLVLTDRGLVPIEQISYNHRLYDGVNWVRHGGLICKGVKEVISYAGITATPEHRVWTEGGWRSLIECKQMGLRIARTGFGRQAVRLSAGLFSGGSCPGLVASSCEAGKMETAQVFDIVNSGPLHRFTVQGLLVSNCIIDYADILLPENPKVDFIQQFDERWRALRRLSQERECLVISPTQANTASYKVRRQGMEHFSGSNSKNSHVGAMLALNQTVEEKEQGVMRLNWTAHRDSDLTETTELWVGQCIPLCRAMCCGAMYHGEGKTKPETDDNDGDED